MMMRGPSTQCNSMKWPGISQLRCLVSPLEAGIQVSFLTESLQWAEWVTADEQKAASFTSTQGDGMQDVFKLRYLKEKQKRLIGMKQQRLQSREILYGERTQRYGNIQHFVSFASKPSSHKLFHDKWWRDGKTFRRSKHLRSALLSASAKDPPFLTWSRWLLYFASFFFLIRHLLPSCFLCPYFPFLLFSFLSFSVTSFFLNPFHSNRQHLHPARLAPYWMHEGGCRLHLCASELEVMSIVCVQSMPFPLFHRDVRGHMTLCSLKVSHKADEELLQLDGTG